MAGLGLIATGAALLNYNKAKSEYDSLIEQRDELMAAYDAISVAVNEYNKHKDDVELSNIDTKSNATFPDGFYITTILRVANLFGKLMRARTSVVFVNNSDKPVYIYFVEVQCNVAKQTVFVFNKDGKKIPQVLKFDRGLEIAPGATVEVQLDGGLSGLQDMDAIRQIVCGAAGKKLITSCPKISITDGQKADYKVVWADDTKTKAFDTYRIGVPGVLRYCGEAALKL